MNFERASDFDPDKEKSRDWIILGIFVLITISCGWIGHFIDVHQEVAGQDETPGLALWLVAPFISGIVLRFLTKNFKDSGLRLEVVKSWRWYIFAFLFYPLLTVMIVTVSYVTGNLIIRNNSSTDLLKLIGTALVAGFLKNVFEEGAWRGFLYPYAARCLRNDLLIHLFTGAVWGLWHMPYYLYFLPEIYFKDISRGGFAILAIFLIMLWTPLFNELRRISGSFWPCVVLHTGEDAVPTALFASGTILQLKGNSDRLLNPVTGVLINIIILSTGILMMKYRRKREERRA